MNKVKNIWRIFVDFTAITACVLSIYIISVGFPNNGELRFDYQAILVGIIAGIFTLLVGWNIYQAIDWKSEIKKVEKLRKELHRELNYVHNKSDYNQGVTYANLSQTLSASFAPHENLVLKLQMLQNGIMAMKIFSRLPDCEIELRSLIKTLIIGLENSSNLHLDDDLKTTLLLSCGEIKNRKSIEHFDKLVNMIKLC